MIEETRCRYMGYSFRLTPRVLLYAPSHRQDNTYHGLCYTRRGALAGTRNSSMGPPYEGSTRRPIAPRANALTTELHLAPIWLTEAISKVTELRLLLPRRWRLTSWWANGTHMKAENTAECLTSLIECCQTKQLHISNNGLQAICYLTAFPCLISLVIRFSLFTLTSVLHYLRCFGLEDI